MGYLFKQSLDVSNSYFVSGSVWFQVSEEGGQALFNVATSDINGGPDGGIYVKIYPGIGVGTHGFELDYRGSAPCRGTINSIFDVLVNRWHHIAFGFDSNHTGAPVGHFGEDPFVCNVVFDGVMRTWFANYWSGIAGMIILNGLDVGMPDLLNANYSEGNAEYKPLARFADFQLWFNKYVDWTDGGNFSKVVKISGGVGTPEDPTKATTAFGAQSILFKGKASDASFQVNRGTVGPFTKVGTISDFTPGPSY